MDVGIVLHAMRDPAGIPSHPVVFQVLMILTWIFHIAFVHMTLGTAALAIYAFYKRRPDTHWEQLSMAMTKSAKVGVSLLMTVGVYGLVAGIVKLDDAGLYLFQRTGGSVWNRFQRAVGSVFLRGAPMLMKFLSIAGTAAMFLVGGGILVHGLGPLHHAIETLVAMVGGTGAASGLIQGTVSVAMDALTGIVAGGLVFAALAVWQRVRKKMA